MQKGLFGVSYAPTITRLIDGAHVDAERSSTDNADMNQAPIRVLHIITRLANGGAAENTIYSVNGLNRSRYAVDLAIGGSPGDDEIDQVEKLRIADDVRVFRVPGLVRDPGLGEIKALYALRRIIRDGGYRIVHTHGAKAGILGRMAARREAVPVIINGIHGHTFSQQMNPIARALYRTIERRVARYTTHFVTVGDDLRRQYIDAGVGTPDTFSVIHSGMELERFTAAGAMPASSRDQDRAEWGVEPHHVLVVNVSRMEPRKGHRFFLEAAAALSGELSKESPTAGGAKLRFMIVGDGPEEAALREQAARLGIADRVIFTGYRTDVERFFAMADVVALTSLWEGLPRVLVQAAATGKPAVTFACDGAAEVVADGETGFVVGMRDVAALTERLRSLVESAELRARMGVRAKSMVNESWTVEAMVTQIEALYEGLVGLTTSGL